jgi:putative membrane protein
MNAVMTLAAPRWGHMGDNGWNTGMWAWGSLIMIFWLGLAVVVTWLVVRSIDNRGAAERSPQQLSADRARDILDERYAKGDINTEDYAERLAHLGI